MVAKSWSIRRKLLSWGAIIALAVLLAGCFGGGGKPKPTHANLKGAGEQIVADTKTVWENFENLASSDWQRIATNFETEIASQMHLMQRSLGFSLETIYIAFMGRLFFFEPGTYSLDDINQGIGMEDHLHTGEWTVQVYEGEVVTATLHYSRESQHNIDTFTYRISSEDDPNLDYRGTLTYSTAILDIYILYQGTEPSGVLTASADFSVIDSNIEPSQATAGLELDLDAMTLTLSDLLLDLEFKNTTNYLKFTGDLVLKHVPNVEDYLLGTLETRDLKITGRIGLIWVENSAEAFTDLLGLAPRKMSVQGIIEEMGTTQPTKLDGTFTVECLNAASFDPAQPMGPDNWLHAKVGFKGLIQAYNNDKLYRGEAELNLEELAYHECYKISGVYKLTNADVVRNLSFSLANTDASTLHVEIDSTWGPAKIVMDAIFTPNIQTAFENHSPPSNVTGSVYVEGTKVGTIKWTGTTVRVDYNDGTYEEF